jgi:sporulation protein YlmC with PRC-barrel domain
VKFNELFGKEVYCEGLRVSEVADVLVDSDE